MQYRVVTTLQFDLLWQSAIDVGVLDTEVDEIHLQRLVRFLSRDPRYFLFNPDEGPANWGRALLIDGPTTVEVYTKSSPTMARCTCNRSNLTDRRQSCAIISFVLGELLPSAASLLAVVTCNPLADIL